MTAGRQEEQPEFGDLMVKCGAGTPQWIYTFLLFGLSALIMAPAVPEVIKGNRSAWFAVGVSCILGCLGWITLLSARVKTEFCRYGVIVKRGRKVLQFMPYSECERFSFVATRDYWQGQYVCTIVELRLESATHASIRWFGRHKETRDLTVAISGRHYEVVDQFDALKHVVTEQIVQRWNESIDSGQSIIWKHLELTPRGITPLREFGNGLCVPYEQIDVCPARAGLLEFRPKGRRFSICANGISKPLAVARTSEMNFWVFLRLLQQMSGKGLDLDCQARSERA